MFVAVAFTLSGVVSSVMVQSTELDWAPAINNVKYVITILLLEMVSIFKVKIEEPLYWSHFHKTLEFTLN